MDQTITPRAATRQRGSFIEICNNILKKGKVLIPVPAVGRAQEILMVINQYMNSGELLQVPVYIEGMISEATGIHTAYPDYLSHEVRDQILKEGINPFESDYFTVVKQHDMRDEIVERGPMYHHGYRWYDGGWTSLGVLQTIGTR